MAQYRATIQGMRGEASRLGTKSSGMKAYVNAWDIGVSVLLYHEHDEDMVRISLTGGSNGGHNTHIGTYKRINGIPNKINLL